MMMMMICFVNVLGSRKRIFLIRVSQIHKYLSRCTSQIHGTEHLYYWLLVLSYHGYSS